MEEALKAGPDGSGSGEPMIVRFSKFLNKSFCQIIVLRTKLTTKVILPELNILDNVRNSKFINMKILHCNHSLRSGGFTELTFLSAKTKSADPCIAIRN